MKRHFKRFMAWILVLTMILGSNTVTVFAEEFSDGSDLFLEDGLMLEDSADSSYTEPASEEYGEIFISSDDFSSVEILDDGSNTIEDEPEEELVYSDEVFDESTLVPEEEIIPVQVFERGYVRVFSNTTVYKNINGEEAGRFLEDSFVYAEVQYYTENLSDDWLKITFDTSYNRENGIDIYTGYVRGNYVVALSQDESDNLYTSSSFEYAVRSYQNYYLPATYYEEYATKEANEISLSDSAEDATAEEDNAVIILEPESVQTDSEAQGSESGDQNEISTPNEGEVSESATSVEETETTSPEEVVIDEQDSQETDNEVSTDDQETEETTEALTEDDTENSTSFESGYVRLSAGTTVYSSASKDDEIGTVDSDAVVYVAEVIRGEDGDIEWMRVNFETTEEKTVDGYAVGASATILDGENEVSIVSFTFKEAETLEKKNVYVPADTIVYEQSNKETVLGTITEAGTVYVLEVVNVDDSVWLQVIFTTESGKSVEGYIHYIDDMSISTEGGSTVVKFQKTKEETEDKGYVRLLKDTIVYSDEECTEELGVIDEDSVVYAEVVVRANTEDSVYKVYFDDEEGSAYIGYVKGDGLDFLPGTETSDITGREYNGFFIPVIRFTAKIKGLTEGLWVYEVVDDYAKVLGYLDYEVSSLSIPDQLGGYYVNAIGEKAFVKNTKLVNMYIHGNVITIADDAFANNNVTLSGYNGTKVLSYAKDHEMPNNNWTNVDHFEFFEEVIDYSYAANDRYSYAGDNTIRMAPAEAAQLNVGSIFYVPEVYGELVEIYKVVSLSKADGWIYITVTTADPEESIAHFSIYDETLHADWSRAEWAEGVELVEEKLTYSSSFDGSINLKYEKPLGQKKAWNGVAYGDTPFSFFVEGKFDVKATASLDYEIHLFKDNVLNDASLIFEPTATIKGGFKATKSNTADKTTTPVTMATPQDYEFYLGSVPLISAAKVLEVKAAVYVKVSVSGEITITVKGSGKIGTKWNKNTKEFESVNTWSWGAPTLSSSVNITIGPAQAVELHCAVLGKVLSLELFEGVVVDVTSTTNLVTSGSYDVTNGTAITQDLGATCFNLKVDGKIALTLKLELELLKKALAGGSLSSKTGYSWELLSFKKKIGEWHFEIGKGIVDKCSYSGVHTVTFNTNTAVKIDSQVVQNNGHVTEPNLTLAGHTAEGWYTDKACTNKWDFANDVVIDDITLYAKWNLNTYTVTYDFGISKITENATEGLTIVRPNDPMRLDYVFENWYKDKTYTTVWDFDNDIMPASDMTLYGKWTKQAGYDPYTATTGGGTGTTDTGGLGYDVEYNGHKYKHIMTYMSYSEAQEYARSHGNGYLMTINSKAEQDILAQYVNYDCAQTWLWLGITNEYGWKYWSTGEEVTYSNWSGQPTTSANQYNGVMSRTAGTWSSLSNTDTAHFVIEWGTPNVSTSLNTTTTDNVKYTMDQISQTAKVTGYTGTDTELVISDTYGGYPVTEIEKSAFKNNIYVELVSLPSGLKTIGQEAFSGCTSLKQISIPDSVTDMGDDVFNGCYSLVSAKMSLGLNNIPKETFYGATALKSVTGINNVTNIYTNAFYNCRNLSSFVFPSGLTTISSYAFYNCSSLPDIVLPDSVTTMNWNAFQYCSGAKAIIVSGGLLSIESRAFYGCTGVTDVYIPSSINKIYDYAFYGVNGKFHVYKGSTAHTWASNESKTIDLLSSATYRVNFVTYTDGNNSSGTIKDGSMTDNEYVSAGSRITEPAIEVDGKVIVGWYLDPEFTQQWDFANDKMPENNITLYAKWSESSDAFSYNVVNGTIIITSYNGSNYNVVIPERINGYTVTGLAESSFVSDNIGILTIPATVKSIVGGAIDCKNLTTVILEGTKYYKTDPYGILYNASGKKLIYVPQGIHLTEYSIPEGTTEILSKSFQNQSLLTKVVFPNSVTSIAYDAFTGLHQLVLYGPLTDCAAKTFATKYSFPYNEYKVYYYNENEMLYDATITAGELIKDYYQPIEDFGIFGGWYQDSALTVEWDFENNVMPQSNLNLYLKWNTRFAVEVDGGTVKITGYSGDAVDVVVPDTINGYTVTGLGFGAFTDSKYKTVTLPNTITNIESGAIGEQVTVIAGKGSIAHSYALTNGLTFKTRKYTIYFNEDGGSEVSDIQLEPGKTAKMPTSIKDNFVFNGWYTDTGYTDEWTEETVMPEEDVYLYAEWRVTSNNLVDGFGYVVLEDGTAEIISYSGTKIVLSIPATVNGYTVTRIGAYSFQNNDTVLTVTVPTTVTSIGEYAFANSSIRTVKGTKNVEVIEEGAFKDAAGLSSIVLTSSLTRIENNAFRGTGLTAFNAQSGLVFIGERAFYDCEYLDTVNLNAQLVSIGKEAFVKCPRLLTAAVPTMVKKDAELAFDSSCILNYKGSTNITITSWSVSDGNLVSLTWNTVKDATQYVIARKTDTVTKMTRFSTYYTEKKASVRIGQIGQTAEIVVIACDDNKKAICTSEPITVYLSELETPSILEVKQAGANKATMTIAKVSGATGYEIERTYTADGEFQYLKRVTVSQFDNTGLLPGGDYYYRIRGYKEVDGEKVYSRYSDTYYFHMPYKYVVAPENVAARQIAAKKIEVTWNEVEGAEGYIIYRSMKGGDYTLFAETVDPYYINTGVVNGRNYSYKICAYFNESGERIMSTLSEEAPITVRSIITPLITGITQFRTSVIKLTWTEVTDASGYMIYRAESKDGSYKKVKTVSTTTTNDLSSVVEGNTYYYKVCAYKTEDDGSQTIGELSPAVSLTVNAVATVEGVTAIQNSADGIKVSWNGFSGIDGYEVWISANNENNYELNTTISEKTTLISGLHDGITYYIKVRAYVLSDSGVSYGEFSEKTGITILGAPEFEVVEQEGTKATRLIWTKIDSADGYEVWRQDGTTATYKLWRTLTGTTALNTSLAYNTVYGYKVRSYKTVDGVKQYSPYSEIKKIRLLDAPTLSKVERTDTRAVTLTWTKVTGAKGYDVYRSNEADGVFKLWKTIDGLSATNTSLTVGSSYFYKVIPYSEVNGEKQLGKPSAVKGMVMLPTPKITSIENASNTSVKVSWNEIEGATGYKLLRDTSENGTYGTVKKVTTLDTTSINLTANTRYYFKVVAYAVVDGITYKSLPSPVNSTYFINLAKPAFKSVEQPTAVSVTLTWGKISGATGYELVRSDSIDGTYKSIKSVTDVSATNTSLKAASTYYYKVRAYKQVSATETAYGIYSDPIAVTLLTAPKITSVDRIGNTNAKVTWNAVDNATGYKLYRSTEVNGTYKLLKTTTDTTYQNSGLSVGTQYYYKVSAINESDGITNIGPKSASGNVTINDLSYTKITSFIQSGDGTVTLKWNAIDGAEGYEVSKAEQGGDFSKVKNTTATSTTITGLTNGNTYSFRVRMYKTVDGSKQYSGYSTSVNVTLMNAPVITSATHTSPTEVVVTWNAVDGATSYMVYQKTANGSYKLAGTVSDTTLTCTGLTKGILYMYKIVAVKATTSQTNKSGYSEEYTSYILESPHSYTNNMNQTWSYTIDGASNLEIKFSSSTQFENNYDKLYITDSSGNSVGDSPYTGTSLAGTTITVPGNTVNLQMTTDGSVTYYGFAIESIKAVN